MAGEKRVKEQEEASSRSPSIILLDVEGTTTSISFVKDTLFPYVRENLKSYIDAKWEDEEFKKDFEKLKEQAKKDQEDKVDGFVPITGANAEEEKESLTKNVLWQMDADRKTGALKQLQGHVWLRAYDSGEVKAHVYDDVPKAMESWSKDGRKIYVYSSGSVEAQKLLFGHSVHGDLLKHFSGYFDTEVGAKQESSSYKNILNKIGTEPTNVVFLTDVVKEAMAAKEAGITAIVVCREGNAPLTDEDRMAFTTIKSFHDLTFESANKRQKLDAPEIEEKKSAKDVGEPMDTSEDVEMTEVSEKRVEKEMVQGEAETGENVSKDESRKEAAPKAAPKVAPKADEPMVTAAAAAKQQVPNNAKNMAENEAAEKTGAITAEVSTQLECSENVKPVVTDKTEESATKQQPESKTEESKLPEKVAADKAPATEESEKAESAPAEPTTPPTAKDPKKDAGTCEEAVEQGSVEKKTEDESTDSAPKESEGETTGATATATKTVEDGSREKSSSNSVGKKSSTEEVAAAKPEKEAPVAKEQSVEKPAKSLTATDKTQEASSKQQESAARVEEKKPDVTENGDVPKRSTEKASIAEQPEATSSKATSAEVKTDATPAKEASKEKETSSEAIEEKSIEPKDKKEEAVQQAAVKQEKSNEAAVEAPKDESAAEASKEGSSVVDDATKDNKNAVDSEKKKLNGTTQNGDTPAKDEKLHRNGLNDEGSSSDNNSSAQNGEPESSSEGSGAESRKVKKVVDSTVADGAGEPDVVPPVVVAATS